MKVRKGGVAFFDSGIGGLTVLAECEKFFSKEIFYYYGDHAHAPYGNLSNRKIKKYVFRAFRLFKKLRVNIDSWTDQLGNKQSAVDYELTEDNFIDFRK